jgi:hypothetical protein
MGLISNLIAYKVGKRSGRRKGPAGWSEHSGLGGSDCAYYDDCVSQGGCINRDCYFPDYEEEE